MKVAKVAQRIGLTISEIAEALERLPPNPQLDDWVRLHGYLVAEAERRVADLNAQLEELASGQKLCELG